MNPVLLPKRKEFGFLKPPSAVSSSTLQISSSQRKLIEQNHQYHHFNYSNHVSSNPRLSSVLSKYSNDSKQFNIHNYIFDPLKVKYEIGNHLFGKSYTNKPNNSILNTNTTTTSNLNTVNTINTINTPVLNHSKTDLFPRQRGMSGSSVRNQIKRHQIISVPINSRIINSSTSSKNKIDATQFLQQLINKRKEKTAISQSCRNCGINYFENNRCLYCEYNNSTNVVWLPNLARQQLVPNNEINLPKQATLNILRAESTSVASCKTPSNANRQGNLSRTKTIIGGESQIKKINDNKSAITQQTQNQLIHDLRDQKVKSTASDYYGDSTVVLEENTDESFNNKNNNSCITNETFNYKINNFQPYDENYKYSNEDEADDEDYQNVIPKLTLWLV